jgi:undecaprenyl-diphosphatase
MIEALYAVDVAIFRFINHTLACGIGDVLWPLITDYDKQLLARIVLSVLFLALLVRGGSRGRTTVLLLVVIITCSDQLSSSVIKRLVQRPRPCHTVDGVPVVPDVHLLVGCGSGQSFPSSHAVNNFAAATLFAWFYRRAWWAFVSWATLVAISRVAVGVHYPSDILGGALIGTLIAFVLIQSWLFIQRRWFPRLDPVGKPGPI